MISTLESELLAVFEYALTGLEYDQTTGDIRALDAYHAAASNLQYIISMLSDSQNPLLWSEVTSNLWSEACRQIQAALDERLQALGSQAGPSHWQPHSSKEDACALPVGCGGDSLDQGREGQATQREVVNEVLSACSRRVTGSLADVAGLDPIKKLLREAVLLPLRFPSLFRGMRSGPRNVLLFGPPGTGKTLLVEKLAAESGLPLLVLAPSSVLSKWAGDSEKTLKRVFDVAKVVAQTNGRGVIIFIDEIDALAPQRKATDDLVARRLLTELLIQLSAVAEEARVFVVGATNRPGDLDPALMRRFHRRLQVPLPDTMARGSFFRTVLLRPELVAAHTLTKSEVAHLAYVTEGCTGSDMQQIAREAAMHPVRDALAAFNAFEEGANRAAADGVGSCGFQEGRQVEAGDGLGAMASIMPEPAVRKLMLSDFLQAVSDMQPAHSMYTDEE